jgi:uncharacterized protein (DUF1697 family)
MTVYIALLRGINVGGHKKIKMAELKGMFEEMGLGRVQTYIQSGNVLFESDEGAGELRSRIEREIERVFGFEVTVVVRTVHELQRVIGSCPFADIELGEGETVYVSLLADEPSEKGVERLSACSSDIDDYRIGNGAVYILCRQSIRKSMFTNNFLEKKLGVPATTRNWQTTVKLGELGKALEGEA